MFYEKSYQVRTRKEGDTGRILRQTFLHTTGDVPRRRVVESTL